TLGRAAGGSRARSACARLRARPKECAVSEFILMLTRNDETVPDARALHEQLSATGATHFGCKDIGLPATELRALLEDMRSAGHTSYLEVVSETPEATLESARVATELRPDYLIGGTLIEPIQAVLAG